MSDYLIHYGVLGMKWGVRKEEKLASRKKQRDVDYISRKEASAESRSRAKQYQRELNDLNKRGYNSKYWKRSIHKTDYEYGGIYDSKKHAMDDLKSEYKRQIEDRKIEAHNYNKMADSIKTTPLNKKNSSRGD